MFDFDHKVKEMLSSIRALAEKHGVLNEGVFLLTMSIRPGNAEKVLGFGYQARGTLGDSYRHDVCIRGMRFALTNDDLILLRGHLLRWNPESGIVIR